MKKKHIFLFFILVLGSILRVWLIGSVPPLNADEAALGYNAYSLLKTGMDEHGNAWPVHFQSFNDYKPGLYVYLIIPFVAIGGLTIWTVRLAGVLAGIASLGVFYALVKKINGNEKVALLSALLLAINPWHIHFSRGGWEVNVAGLFILMGLYFLLSARDHHKHIVWSGVSFVAAMYTYHSARVVIPLILLGYVALYWKELWREKKHYFLGM